MFIDERVVLTVTLLVPQGRLDRATHAEFGARLQDAIRQSQSAGKAVVLDFGAVDYVSSIGLREIMKAAHAAHANGVALRLASPSPVVRQILDIARFHFVIAILDTVERALAELSPDAARLYREGH